MTKSSYKALVVDRFSAKAADYDGHAEIQKLVAARLALALPKVKRPDVLEIGCGTGLFTSHLLAAYPDGRFDITDLSEVMLHQCEKRFPAAKRLRYAVMDGEQPNFTGRYDVIALSMTAQWFDDPSKSIAGLRTLLKPTGHLLYSTIGPNLFPQWRAVLQGLGLACGLLPMPNLPGEISEEYYPFRFESGVQFLDGLRQTGASTPRRGYQSLSGGELRKAMRLFEQKADCRADWHILYGKLAVCSLHPNHTHA